MLSSNIENEILTAKQRKFIKIITETDVYRS